MGFIDMEEFSRRELKGEALTTFNMRLTWRTAASWADYTRSMPRFTCRRKTMRGCRPNLRRPGKNAIGTAGWAQLPGDLTTADMLPEAGAGITTSKQVVIFRIG